MAHHYHIVSRLDMTKFGGTTNDHYYGPGLPLVWAQEDAQGLAKDAHGFLFLAKVGTYPDHEAITTAKNPLDKIAGGVWTNAPDADAFNDDLTGQYAYIYIDPCDNEVDFDLPWNAYRDENHEFRRAPKGKPCSSLVKKEYADRL